MGENNLEEGFREGTKERRRKTERQTLLSVWFLLSLSFTSLYHFFSLFRLLSVCQDLSSSWQNSYLSFLKRNDPSANVPGGTFISYHSKSNSDLTSVQHQVLKSNVSFKELWHITQSCHLTWGCCYLHGFFLHGLCITVFLIAEALSLNLQAILKVPTH